MSTCVSSSPFKSSHRRPGTQRFLVASSLFPPDVLGGAEMSAYNLAKWLVDKGFEIGVITTAKTPADACEDRVENGMRVWRFWMPRPYPIHDHGKAPFWKKIIWHCLDHFDPRNRKAFVHVLDAFKPDFINIHLLQGLGWNALRVIEETGIPTTFFLHDLGLACARMSMFQADKECRGHCLVCRASSAFKRRWLGRGSGFAFVSPSQANIDKLSHYFPLKLWPHIAILNANKYPKPSHPHRESDRVRFVYVGRLHATKGIHLLLQAASALASRYDFTLTVVGSGPDENKLRAAYEQEKWCRFTGFVTQEQVAEYMGDSDVLCIPSIWAENSPGVVIHALSLGLPVIGSDKAGIPELVEHEKNGLLVPPGDLDAWKQALERVLVSPASLEPWRRYAMENAGKFDQDSIAEEVFDFISSQGAPQDERERMR